MGDKKFRILAIDGGGIRGVIPIQFIKHIEKITGQEIHKSFDLIAGTSTGAIIASALLFPNKKAVEGNTRMLSLDEIEKIYVDRGVEIFPAKKTKFGVKWGKAKNLFKPLFKPDNLHSILKEKFEDATLAQCLKPILITSYDIVRDRPVIFTYRDAKNDPDKNASLVDACRATSAAPTYFPSYKFDFNNSSHTFIDGGIYMNNPSLGSLIEVLGNNSYKNYKLNDLPLEIKDISILSLGTGLVTGDLPASDTQNWGNLSWIKPIVDLSLNAPAQVIDKQMRVLFKSFDIEHQYLRLNVTLERKFAEMSNCKKENINHLISKAQTAIDNNETLIERLKIHLDIP